jgi:hypothetical protein
LDAKTVGDPRVAIRSTSSEAATALIRMALK